MTCSPWVPPTVAQFKTQFFRDFGYAPEQIDVLPPTPEGLNKYIYSLDIQNAINEASGDFNPRYGASNVLIFLYLAAHTMIESIRASSMGLNSQAKFPLESSSVGGASIVNSIPDIWKNDPNYAKYLTTFHGKKYLGLVYPFTVGGGLGIVPGQQTYA